MISMNVPLNFLSNERKYQHQLSFLMIDSQVGQVEGLLKLARNAVFS